MASAEARKAAIEKASQQVRAGGMFKRASSASKMPAKSVEASPLELDDALHRAIHVIEFMHGCLTEKGKYEYAFPDHTALLVEDLRSLTSERPEGCVHGRTVRGCEACEDHVKRAAKRSPR